MIDTLKAILTLDPTAQVSVIGEDITWHDGNPNSITLEQITTKQQEVKDAYDNDYARKRKAEYPTMDELIVALWESVVEERMASVTALEAVRQTVKAKYPK